MTNKDIGFIEEKLAVKLPKTYIERLLTCVVANPNEIVDSNIIVEKTLQMREHGAFFGRSWPKNAVIIAEFENGDVQVVRGNTEDDFALQFSHAWRHPLSAYHAAKVPLRAQTALPIRWVETIVSA